MLFKKFTNYIYLVEFLSPSWLSIDIILNHTYYYITSIILKFDLYLLKIMIIYYLR